MGPQYKGHLWQFLVSLQPQETRLWAASLEVHLSDHLGRRGEGGGQKEILPGGHNWSNVLILMKVRHWGGGGREGRAGEGRMEGREILPGGWNWSNVLIQMKVRHWGGGPPSNLGVWRPLPLCSTAYGGGGWEGGRREGGYRLIISVSWLSTTETHARVTSHFRWPG